MAYFKEYPYITENIDPSYDLFIAKIKEIILITDQLFTTQIHPTYGLYSEEVIHWITNNLDYNPDPLSVSRIENGHIKEIPFHIFYKDAMKRLAKHLDEGQDAIDQIIDESFNKDWWKEYLNILKRAYVQNSWDEADAFFLQTPTDSPILLSIGPIDTYHDKTKGTKRYFSAWLIVKNTAAQRQATIVTNHLTTMTNTDADITFYIGDLLFAGGEVAKHKTMGWSRSGNTELKRFSKSLKMIAFNKLPEHTQRMTQAIQKSVQTWEISNDLGESIMTYHKTQSLIPLVLHEYSHTYEKSNKAQINLQEYYTDIEETRANTYMVYLAKQLEKAGHLSKHTAHIIFLRVLLYLPYLYEEYSKFHQRESYYFAGLYWLQKAESAGIVSIDKTITLHEEHLDEKIDNLISECRSYLFDISEKGLDGELLAKQKKDILLFGADIAITLRW